MQQVFHGEKKEGRCLTDLTMRETVMMAAMIIVIFWIGMFPRPLLSTAGPALLSPGHGQVQEQPVRATGGENEQH